MEKINFDLQPLRIQAGWKVVYNYFSEYDLSIHGEEYDYELNEDLLQIENGNLLIDLGWYPAMDINGKYILFLVDKNSEGNPFDNPLEIFETVSKVEVISKLEYWMNRGHYEQFL